MSEKARKIVTGRRKPVKASGGKGPSGNSKKKGY